MPKKLIYTEGPLVMGCGAAGEFRINVPKEAPDDLAAILLRKGRHREFTEPAATTAQPAPAESVRATGRKKEE